MMSAPVLAGDEVIYEPAPDWIAREPVPGEIAGPPIVLFNEHRRIEAGRLWTFSERAIRIDNPQTLQSLGTITFNWLPDKGDLIVHEIAIVRDGTVIDVLAEGARLDVLRRERQLEMRTLDGARTATLAVPGLRVGDVLLAAYSVTLSDQALNEEVQAVSVLPAAPFEAQRARSVMSWPVGSDVRWRATRGVEPGEPQERGGYAYLAVDLPLAELDEVPPDAPLRYRMPPLLLAGTFADWREVSATMAPLYTVEGMVAADAGIAALVGTIRSEQPTAAAQAVAALRLVQDEIAYLANGMEGGNYIPQTPQETWRNRFGDCKAKSVLLLAMLRELGIASEVVLVASQTGDGVPEMLPLPGAFDHMIVRAEIDGQSYWLDGTSSGATLASLDEVPPFYHALPLRDGGAELMAMEPRASEHFDVRTSMTYDFSAGLDLPVPFTGEWVLSGPSAAPFAGLAGQVGEDQLDMLLTGFVQERIGATQVLAPRLEVDRQANTVRVMAEGLMRQAWTFDGPAGSLELHVPSTAFAFAPDRTRAAWRDIPAATFGPLAEQVRLQVILPEEEGDFTIEGREQIDAQIANATIARESQFVANRFEVVDSVRYLPGELDRDRIREERFKVARLGSTQLTLKAPVTAARRWQYAGATGDPRLEPIRQAYAEDIARDPEDMRNYADRGNFRWYISDYSGAEEDYSSAIALQGTPELYNDRGYVRRQTGDLAGAVEDYMESYLLDPTPERSLALAEAMIADRQFDAARDLLETLEGTSGEQRSAQLYLADLEAQEGDAQSGLERIAALEAQEPGDAGLLNARCWHMAAWQVALDEAVAVCTRAVESARASAAVLDSRALAYLRTGALDRALDDIERALELSPHQTESVLLRGLIRRAQGEPQGEADICAALLREPVLALSYGKFGFDLD